ncbi:ArsR/SmtB family transcription factor [Flexivirga caeni]|uniref:ArsR family transcriptional regulator n=1 Tax=Flexivirga caeni TaxID=2294115 RepID=A0A3M9MIF1_9MICO|nr:helix-turn-helix domain-containing protein [Flexivirga caeni]RNI25349.1 ArsR family transcriptional regulator [Flexivirga caeni]
MSLEDEAIAELRATAHPVRLRMLSLLTGAPMSAAELARELDITQANASYHLRTLAKAGQVQVVETESVRGGQAKKYRYRYPEQRPNPNGQRPQGVSRTEWQQYIHVMYGELVRRSEQRIDGPAISADAEVWLTPETWRKARELVKKASRLVHDEALSPHAPGSAHVNFQVELFTMHDDRDGEQPEK